MKILLFWASIFLCFAPAVLITLGYARMVKKRRLALRQRAVDEGRQVAGTLIARKARKEGLPDNKGRHLARYQYTGADGKEYAHWFSLSAVPPKKLPLYLRKGKGSLAVTEAQMLNGKSPGIVFLVLFIVALFASHQVNLMLLARVL